MPPRPSAPHSASPRRFLPRALLCLSLALAMAAAPWWQPAFARGAQDIPAMALCSAGSGGAPAHLAAGHCQLCCGSQLPQSLPESGPAAAIASGASYPLAPAGLAERSASLAPGAARARAPPAA